MTYRCVWWTWRKGCSSGCQRGICKCASDRCWPALGHSELQLLLYRWWWDKDSEGLCPSLSWLRTHTHNVCNHTGTSHITTQVTHRLHLFNSEIWLPQNLNRKRDIINSTKIIWIPWDVIIAPPLQEKWEMHTKGEWYFKKEMFKVRNVAKNRNKKTYHEVWALPLTITVHTYGMNFWSVSTCDQRNVMILQKYASSIHYFCPHLVYICVIYLFLTSESSVDKNNNNIQWSSLYAILTVRWHLCQSCRYLRHRGWHRAALLGKPQWAVCSLSLDGSWRTARCFESGSGSLKHLDNCSSAQRKSQLQQNRQTVIYVLCTFVCVDSRAPLHMCLYVHMYD